MPGLTAPATVAILVTGIPGAGKTTVAKALAQRFARAAHIEVDLLQEMIVSGGLWPDQQPREEAMRQLELRARHGAMLAASFVDAGITAVLDDVIVGPDRLALCCGSTAPARAPRRPSRRSFAPSRSIAGHGRGHLPHRARPRRR